MNSFSFRPIDRKHAELVVAWEYPAPYNIYNIPVTKRPEVIESFLKPEYRYYSVSDGEKFIAFRCFGHDAQVPGGNYDLSALDIGGGLHPDLTGQGLGKQILSAAISFANTNFAPQKFRTTIAEFNTRARRTCEKVGFYMDSSFWSQKLGRPYIILTMNSNALKS